VVRFPCPHCGNNLKASVDRAGRVITCPDCGQRTPIPSADTPRAATETTQLAPPSRPIEPAAEDEGRVMEFFSGMSRGTVLALLGTVALGVVCLVLLGKVGAGTAEQPAGIQGHLFVIAAFLSLLACLGILYGHGTRCPHCGRWYARRDTGKETADSEVRQKDGPALKGFRRDEEPPADDRKAVLRVVVYHHKHRCAYCGHQWVTVSTDEFESTVRRRQLADLADKKPDPHPKRYRID
jgi:transcription elongation factor Elf1